MGQARSKTVLLVEDDDDAQAIYGSWLSHLGWDVTLAPTLGRAREVVYDRRPDVVVLDCRLPDGDGLDLLVRWKRTPWMGEIPVVVLTAFGTQADQMEARRRGADVFLVKPCTGETLAAHVSAAVARKPRTSSTGRFRARSDLGLHAVEGTRFQARCAQCFRSSPLVAGTAADAAKEFTALEWRFVDRKWACPICLARRPTRPPAPK